MPWVASDLATLPTMAVASARESRADRTTITEFAGELEQRIRYAGHHALLLDITTGRLSEAAALNFASFWAARKGSLEPFKMVWNGTLRYWRFNGQYSIQWVPPKLATLTFSLREVHPSEIIL
ncbi:MAG: hypothetical protein ACK52W_09695 [Alphaproteobacteria bacterium]